MDWIWNGSPQWVCRCVVWRNYCRAGKKSLFLWKEENKEKILLCLIFSSWKQLHWHQKGNMFKNFNSFKIQYFNFVFWFQGLGLLRTDSYWKVIQDLLFKTVFKILLSVANSARENITLSCENRSWPLHSFHTFADPIENSYFTLWRYVIAFFSSLSFHCCIILESQKNYSFILLCKTAHVYVW